MKFVTLHLKAVGPFTDVRLDFSAGSGELHMIYGPNEAGKTSTLRSLSHLLFGFPHLSSDNFIHANDQLRVGATLRRALGEELEIVRRRGKNSLRGSDDSTPVGEDQLARFLGGIDRDTFETIFSIDHARLVKAGDEIRTGKGRLGELLFAAGAGLAGLGEARSALARELDELFKPRADKPRINKGLAELHTVQAELKRSLLPSETWRDHDRRYREASDAADRIRGEMRIHRAEQGRLKRIKFAIPLLVKRRGIRQELDALADAKRLRPEYGGEFRAVADELRLAERDIVHANEALRDLDSRLAQLDPQRAILDAAREIESLQERLGVVENAAKDRARLEQFSQDREHQARRILRELGRPSDVEQAETLRLRVDEPALIRGLAQQFAELRVRVETARKTIARHGDQIKRSIQAIEAIESPRALESLRRAVRLARKAGDLDQMLGEARRKVTSLEKAAVTAVAQLPGWDRLPRDLMDIPVPLAATIDRWEARFRDLEQKNKSHDERLREESESLKLYESRLRALELNLDIPTESTLQSARERRERGWQLIRSDWLDGKRDQPSVETFLADFAPGTALVSAYEESVSVADILADRLRREADRVAQKAESLAQLDRSRRALNALEAERTALDQTQLELDREWSALIATLRIGDNVSTPAELRAWLRQRDQAVQILQKCDEEKQALEPLEASFGKAFGELERALAEFGECPAETATDLTALLDHAERTIERHDDLAKKRAKLEASLTTGRAEQTTAEDALTAAEDQLAAWRTTWSAMMARIGLEADALPDQAEVFLNKISELFEALKERGDFQSRIQGIDRDAVEFQADVTALSARVGLDRIDGAADTYERARELFRLSRIAQRDDQAQSDLARQREREAAKLAAAEDRRDRARISLERLCKEAGCADISEVPEAERRSTERLGLEAASKTCEEEIAVAAAGLDLDEFLRDAQRANPDALDAAIEDLDKRLNLQENELRTHDQTIGTESAELARMNGGDSAALCAERVQTLLTRLSSDVTRFATLRLAAVVLERGIERYREKSQGPIVASASALFNLLTGGSFASLQIDDDGEGHAVLKGVRPDGRLICVDGMSDGSHDQLYLALRLASLESFIRAHEPIPFVVDDILLNFDDARATAALLALAELSRQTQVLFFTHHRHIIDLAHANLPDKDIVVHELPKPGAPPALSSEPRRRTRQKTAR
jgi:uncharacterized protein YhaN